MPQPPEAVKIELRLPRRAELVGVRNWLDFGFDRVYDQPVIIDDFIILSHVPMFLNDLANSNAKAYLNIHGHVHGNWYANSHYINVCAERINYSPANLDKIVKENVEKLKMNISTREKE